MNNTGKPTGESYVVMFSSFKYLSVKGFFTKNQSVKCGYKYSFALHLHDVVTLIYLELH